MRAGDMQRGFCYRLANGTGRYFNIWENPVLSIVSVGPKWVRYRVMGEDGQVGERVYSHNRTMFDSFKWELC